MRMTFKETSKRASPQFQKLSVYFQQIRQSLLECVFVLEGTA